MDEHERIVRSEIDQRFKTQIDTLFSDYAVGKTSYDLLLSKMHNVLKNIRYEVALRYVDTLSREQTKQLAARFITEILNRQCYENIPF